MPGALCGLLRTSPLICNLPDPDENLALTTFSPHFTDTIKRFSAHHLMTTSNSGISGPNEGLSTSQEVTEPFHSAHLRMRLGPTLECPLGRQLGHQALRSNPACHPGCGRVLASTYFEYQLLGRRGHEDAVAPCGAPGVHVLLALTGVLAVRVAVETRSHSINSMLASANPVVQRKSCAIQGKNAHTQASGIEVSQLKVFTSNLPLPVCI
jgi:hypothetical protein